MVEYHDPNRVAEESWDAIKGRPEPNRCYCGRQIEDGQRYCDLCKKIINNTMKYALLMIGEDCEFDLDEQEEAAVYWLENKEEFDG